MVVTVVVVLVVAVVVAVVVSCVRDDRIVIPVTRKGQRCGIDAKAANSRAAVAMPLIREQSLNARCSELVLMRVYFTQQQQILKKKKGAKFLDRACVRCGFFYTISPVSRFG